MSTERKVKAFLQDIITPQFLERIEKWSKYDGEKFSIGDADVYIEDLGTWTKTLKLSRDDMFTKLLGKDDIKTEYNVTLLRDAATCSNYNQIVLVSEKRHEFQGKHNQPKLYVYCVFDKLEEGEESGGLLYADDSQSTSYPSLERLKKDFESGTFMHHNSLLSEFCGVYTLSPFNDVCDRIYNFTLVEGDLNFLECAMSEEDEDYAKHIPIIKRPENKHIERKPITMNKLKAKEVKHFEVDYGDLESLIEEVYGGGYCFMADVECDNDSTTELSVSQDDIDSLDEETIEEIRTNVSSCQAHNILALLVKDGHAEKGDYLVQLSY